MNNRPIKFRALITNKNYAPLVGVDVFRVEGKLGAYLFYQDDQYLGSFLRRANQWQFDSSGHDSYGQVELMQFTGLLDKNGKEIYEGDMLLEEDGGLAKVEWRDGAFYAVTDNHGELLLDEALSEPLGYIHRGNIYENPELIK